AGGRPMGFMSLLLVDVHSRRHSRAPSNHPAPRDGQHQPADPPYLFQEVNRQNSWPSGSAITTQLTSPRPMSTRVAPRDTSRSASACWSPSTGGARSKCSRCFPVLGIRGGPPHVIFG